MILLIGGLGVSEHKECKNKPRQNFDYKGDKMLIDNNALASSS